MILEKSEQKVIGILELEVKAMEFETIVVRVGHLDQPNYNTMEYYLLAVNNSKVIPLLIVITSTLMSLDHLIDMKLLVDRLQYHHQLIDQLY